MSFNPGLPLPDAEHKTSEAARYYTLAADYRIVVLERRSGRWYWHFVAGHRPGGSGTWAELQHVLQSGGARG